MIYGSLNLLEPSGSVQACTEIALSSQTVNTLHKGDDDDDDNNNNNNDDNNNNGREMSQCCGIERYTQTEKLLQIGKI
jgi:hypothetical protein